ncbi:MAG: hypothetical protein IJH47_00925 [Oscillospiraceae bacterium]|nr:hypothetical protein [Oscillospiraceae bacterium]
MDEEKKRKKKHRQAAATAVAAVTSAGVVMGGMFASPDDLLNGNDDGGGSVTVTDTYTPDAADGDDIDEIEAGEEDDESRRRGVRARARQWIWRLPYGVRAVIGVPLWAVGWLIITGATALWSGVLSPVFGTILGWIVTAAVLLGAFALTGKALFPDLPLKKIVNKRNFLALLIGTAVLAVADNVVPLFWDGYAKIAGVVRAVGSAGLLGGVTAVFAKRERRRRKKLAEKAARAAEKEPPETMAQALRRARELADSVRPSGG